MDFEETPDNLELCTRLVSNIIEAGRHSDQILHILTPGIAMEDENVAFAVRMACQEFTDKVMSVRSDLEVLTKVPRPRTLGKLALDTMLESRDLS